MGNNVLLYRRYPVNGGMEDWAYAASWDFHDPTDKKQHARGTVCTKGPIGKAKII